MTQLKYVLCHPPLTLKTPVANTDLDHRQLMKRLLEENNELNKQNSVTPITMIFS